MSEKPKKLTIKEKAVKYDNWIKWVASRGLTDVLVEPLKVKEKMDDLKREITDLKGKVHTLDISGNGLRERNKKLQATLDKK